MGFSLQNLALIPDTSGSRAHLPHRKEVFDERVAILSAWSYLPISSGIRHLFLVGTYANLVCDAICLFLVYLLLKSKISWCILLGALLPFSHISSWYLLFFLFLVSLCERKPLFSLPLAAATFTTLLVPGVISALVSYLRGETLSLSICPKEALYFLLSLLKKIEIDLGLWAAVPISGIILLRGKIEKWLFLYALGYLILAYLSHAIIFAVGFDLRFILQLSLPFSVISGLALRKVVSVLHMPNLHVIGAAVFLAWFLTNPVPKQNQWIIWNDLVEFRDLASGREVVVLGGAGITNYLEVVGCKVVGKVTQPWNEMLREKERIIAVSLSMPPEYRLKPPCFVEAFRTSRLVAYQPLIGCEPPEFEIVSSQLNPPRVKLVCKKGSLSMKLALDPKSWVVYVEGLPCKIMRIGSSSDDPEIEEGDEIVLEFHCQRSRGVRISLYMDQATTQLMEVWALGVKRIGDVPRNLNLKTASSKLEE